MEDEDTRQRLLYAALALLAGLPGLLFGGAVALLGVYAGLVEPGRGTLPVRIVLSGWGLAGLAGALAWLWLSAAFLMQGKSGLRGTASVWWWLLLAGVLTTLPVVALASWLALTQDGEALSLLLLGPPLLLPTALLWHWRRA
ncbi:hypothetical protein [Marilutibacter alkalisoli]|uniref:Transmembrane protein n=1 Tax=Marilutibacter alkalisoli TaxID=2591633 RepID=A0A514BU85_9GAMM|nr:hypothetical protein [Lysobacter alkalisoli]QDH70978.1 hypothetical protein FKV23_13455 [Lysobacter alkalisoli]